MNMTKRNEEGHIQNVEYASQIMSRTGADKAPAMHPNIRLAIAEALDRYSMTWQDTFAKRNVRNPPALAAKRAVCHTLRKDFGLTYRRMGEILGLDHATMIYHTKLVDKGLNLAA